MMATRNMAFWSGADVSQHAILTSPAKYHFKKYELSENNCAVYKSDYIRGLLIIGCYALINSYQADTNNEFCNELIGVLVKCEGSVIILD